MSETWYRGEGVGVTPAKAGSVMNDIGAGMYLTDKLEVAKQYAQERAPHPNDRRVYSVPVDRGGLRVLDLTADPRWRKMLDMPIPSEPGLTFEGMIRRQPAAQQYEHAFNGFLTTNKINLDNYDAVIGYEYRSGGKQMCILYKGGQPSPVQAKLRLLFVPIGGVIPTPKSPPGTLRLGGKIGPGLKIAGGTLLLIAVQILIQWLVGKINAKQQEEDLQKKMEKILPKIETDVQRNKQSALVLLVEGKKSFATARISVTKTNFPQIPYPGANPEIMNIPLDLDYLSMEITDKEENKPDGEEHGVLKDVFPSAGTYDRHFYKMSFSLTFIPEEVNLYSAFLKEIEWYESQIKSAPSAYDMQRLSEDRDKLIAQLNAALAD